MFSLRGEITTLVLFVGLSWISAGAEILPWEPHIPAFGGNVGFGGLANPKGHRRPPLPFCMDVAELCPELAVQ